MAKPVKLPKGKEFHFTSGGGSQPTKYPWGEWFTAAQEPNLILLEKDGQHPDGKVIKRDFDVEVDAMPGKIKTAARRHYKVVQISRKDADGKKLVDSLIIRSRDMNQAERTAEDAQRVEDRQKNKERILATKAKKDAEGTATATSATPPAQGENAA